MEQPSPLQLWYDRHKDKITWGMILYLFATNQAQQLEIKNTNERATSYENRYIDHIKAERLEATRALFRRLLDSDTTFILGIDSSLDTAFLYEKDTSKRKARPN